MGMYDDVDAPALPCWNCGAMVAGWQSKDGERLLLSIPTTEIDSFYSCCEACGAWNEYARPTVRRRNPVFVLDATASRLSHQNGAVRAESLLAEQGAPLPTYVEPEPANEVFVADKASGSAAECTKDKDGTTRVSFHVKAHNNSYKEHADDLVDKTWFAFYIEPDGDVTFRIELMSTEVKGVPVDSQVTFEENQRALRERGFAGYDYDLVIRIPKSVFALVVECMGATLTGVTHLPPSRQAR